MGRATELYDISTRLAVGDAGFVYKATERATGRIVALKLLLPEEQIGHPLDVDSLLRDAPDISRFTGANVAQLLDAFADDDGTVLVYEFADGTRGLDVPQRFPIAAAQSVDVAAQLLSALRSGERQGYPHGDLKPSDVSLVRLPDGRPFVMVLDWGLANYRKEPTPGALAFTAPERLYGAPPSHVADLFSAGAVLVYLFTGRQMVEGATKEDFAAAWHLVNTSALGLMRPDLPAALVQWVAHLLQPDASRRPSSAVDALASLAALNPPLPPAVPEHIRPRPARPHSQPQPQPRAVQSAIAPVPVLQSGPTFETAQAATSASSISLADEARKELARLQRKKQSLTLFTTYFVIVATLGVSAFAVWKRSRTTKERELAEASAPSSPTLATPAPSTPAPATPAPSIPAPSTPVPPQVAVRPVPEAPKPQKIPAPVAEAPKSPAPVAATIERAIFSNSPNPPIMDGADIANFATPTATDKWFYEAKDEGYDADAAKGITFTTGNAPVLFRALTYKLVASSKKGATPKNPTIWTIQVGTLTGIYFDQIASEEAQQTADTGAGDYITWNFKTPVPLAANTTYAVDVAMRSGTPWTTGVPYLACSQNVTTPGVGILYNSGDRGVAGTTISPVPTVDRIFHLDLQKK